ncbi:MAG: hypothetical protein LBR31_04230 [Desulfovibrio sp.]|jgi:fumarate reductase subunit C|nr:hypothetical protein [Desulfovibrio sp.]
MATKRKPYIREVNAGWWKKLPFYRDYMLREGTSVFAVWVSVVLLVALLSPDTFMSLVKNPLVIILNLAAFLASLLHTKTWYALVPKILNLPEAILKRLVQTLWGLTIGVSVVVLALAAASY